MDDFKAMLRAVWASGDYAALSDHIADVGERLVARVGAGPGTDVLDVACGTGNAALPAARAGARVTGVDLAPPLLEAGRRKAAEAGVEIEWVEGDAESLPFDDDSFDVVLSTFGHMFAPRHRETADELTRVCRKGGSIGLCTWTPDGSVGDTFRAAVAYQPPPPPYASPPLLWGDESYVREMFADVATDFAFERHDTVIEWESLESWTEYFMARFPPFVAARQNLGERFADFRADIEEVWRRRNEASDGSFRLPQQYLLSVIRL
jgi:SAM-dependent methyltransferase